MPRFRTCLACGSAENVGLLQRTCPGCGTPYERPTGEPDPETAALALVGKLVIFRHWVGQPQSENPPMRVKAADKGMVELQGFVGRFAPHLFVVVEEEHRA